MVTIRAEISADVTAREALLDRAFGRTRQRKTSQRFRDDRLPAEGLAFTALSKSGRVIGTLRMWNVIAGSAGPALLLGPLAVDGRYQRRGIGRELMTHALNMAKVLGHTSVLLVGMNPITAVLVSRGTWSRICICRARLTATVSLALNSRRERLTGLKAW